jgi:hypothetical protein
MTLFTGDGTIRAHNRFLNKGLSHVPTVVHHAIADKPANVHPRRASTPTNSAGADRGRRC